MVWVAQKMRCYLEKTLFKVTTDYQALFWLHNLKNPTERLAIMGNLPIPTWHGDWTQTRNQERGPWCPFSNAQHRRRSLGMGKKWSNKRAWLLYSTLFKMLHRRSWRKARSRSSSREKFRTRLIWGINIADWSTRSRSPKSPVGLYSLSTEKMPPLRKLKKDLGIPPTVSVQKGVKPLYYANYRLLTSASSRPK